MRIILLLLVIGAAPVWAQCSRSLRLQVDNTTLMPAEQRELAWIERVMAKNHCTLTIIQSTAATTKRRLNDLRDGLSDMWFGCSKTAEREQFLFFSEPYIVDEVRRYVRVDSMYDLRDDELATLLERGVHIMVPLTGWYGEQMAQFRTHYQSDKRLMFYRHNVLEAVSALQKRRVDLLVTTKRQLIDAPAGLSRLVVYVPPALMQDPLHIVFSKKTVALADFNYLNKVFSREIALLITAP